MCVESVCVDYLSFYKGMVWLAKFTCLRLYDIESPVISLILRVLACIRSGYKYEILRCFSYVVLSDMLGK